MAFRLLSAVGWDCNLPRFRLDLEFDGNGYVGWQRQKNGPSIQETLETAIFEMLGERATAVSAGRTDAGVHALALTVHIDLMWTISADRLQAGLNYYLQAKSIAVVEATEAVDDFHARFAAVARHYRYIILNRRAPPTLEQGHVWHVPRPLDLSSMQAAATELTGHHDFTSFRASECQAKSPLKTLTSIVIERKQDLISFKLEAPSFLHHQVRNIVGTLKLIGAGTKPVGFAKMALHARSRSAAGPTAPARGLYFVRAEYPANLAQRT